MKRCSVFGCTRSYLCKGYCHRHYYAEKRGAALVPERQRKPFRPERGTLYCAVPNCKKEQYSFGVCQVHYQLVRDCTIGEGRLCTMPGCLLRHVAKGLCRMHYKAKRHFKQAQLVISVMKESDSYEGS